MTGQQRFGGAAQSELCEQMTTPLPRHCKGCSHIVVRPLSCRQHTLPGEQLTLLTQPTLMPIAHAFGSEAGTHIWAPMPRVQQTSAPGVHRVVPQGTPTGPDPPTPKKVPPAPPGNPAPPVPVCGSGSTGLSISFRPQAQASPKTSAAMKTNTDR